MRVKLKCNLTHIHQQLIDGVEGDTTEHGGWRTQGSDRFTGVIFPFGAFDLLWDSLEITDPIALAEIVKRKEKELNNLAQSKNIEYHVGPRGGFKCFCFTYKDKNHTIESSTCFKDDADRLMEHAKKLNLPVTVIRHRGKTGLSGSPLPWP